MIRVKVCGMKEPVNIGEIVAKRPDIMGFIFFPGSKRFVGFEPGIEIFGMVPQNIKRAGVFVNEKIDFVLKAAGDYDLHIIQLHGCESPDFCNVIRKSGYMVIKSFGIGGDFDFNQLDAYAGNCDYFLFDTFTHSHGGSGKQFDWAILDQYTLNLPFILSGGIGTEDVSRIRELMHPMFYGVDINSRFEISPGVKDAEKVGHFINKIREQII